MDVINSIFFIIDKLSGTYIFCPQQGQFGVVEGDFALGMSLYHAYELLQRHGLRPFYNFLTGIVNGEKSFGRTRAVLLRNDDFNDVMVDLKEKFTQNKYDCLI